MRSLCTRSPQHELSDEGLVKELLGNACRYHVIDIVIQNEYDSELIEVMRMDRF